LMFVCCECCVLSGRGLCDELITRPEEPYRLWCAVVCDLENLKNEEVMTRVGSQRHSKKKNCMKSKQYSTLLYAFFWVIPRRLNFICRRFGTLCSIFTCLWRWNRQSVPKRRHIKFRRQGITQKKTYNSQKFGIKNTILFTKTTTNTRYYQKPRIYCNK